MATRATTLLSAARHGFISWGIYDGERLYLTRANLHYGQHPKVKLQKHATTS